ncbi:MAG: oxidoreductase [Nitrospinae bacterium CG11_big_fil_rev_8_21_14_0_20_45_15]|nr:MAG: oxidoreductase [Nitrospinae bacterium CG11_big_fil_rev_8_21_14_0_20_45_15]
MTRLRFLGLLLQSFFLLILFPLKVLGDMVPRVISKRKETLPITSVTEFYIEDISGPPDNPIDPWHLKISGQVANSLDLSLAQIRALPSIQQIATLTCIGNPVGGRAMGNARWTGVPLKSLLKKADPEFLANRLILRAGDGYYESIPLKKGYHPGALLAYQMNDQPLTRDHGYPLRLILPGLYGIKQVKWLNEIEISRGSFKGYWQERGWTQKAQVKICSRIDTPQNAETLPFRTQVIKGIAFSGDRGIQYVQVSTDGEKSWALARLEKPLSPYSWVFWSFKWKPYRRGPFNLAVKATDLYSGRQEDGLRDAFPSGVAGIHRIQVYIA